MFIETNEYEAEVVFSYHAFDRLVDRFVSKDIAIDILKRGMQYIDADVEYQQDHPEKEYTMLRDDLTKYSVVCVRRWTPDFAYLQIKVITVIDRGLDCIVSRPDQTIVHDMI